MSIFIDQDFLRTIAWIDGDIFGFRLSNLFFACRPDITAFQTAPRDRLGFETMSGTSAVDSNVSTADDNDIAI